MKRAHLTLSGYGFVVAYNHIFSVCFHVNGTNYPGLTCRAISFRPVSACYPDLNISCKVEELGTYICFSMCVFFTQQLVVDFDLELMSDLCHRTWYFASF